MIEFMELFFHINPSVIVGVDEIIKFYFKYFFLHPPHMMLMDRLNSANLSFVFVSTLLSWSCDMR